MNLQASYFSVGNPFEIISRWLNPYRFTIKTCYQNKDINVSWTRRAERALNQCATPITIEMQLYFSCMVKKRVLFYMPDDKTLDKSTEILKVNDKINIMSCAVQSDICSAEEFAHSHPVKRVLKSDGAKKMLPKELNFDYINGHWIGEFYI